MGSPYLFQNDILTQLPDIPADTIVSRTFSNTPEYKAILFGFAAGQELSEHTASKVAILHFLQGEARLKLGTDEFEARPGTWVSMPPNLPHSVFARTKVVMLLYMLEGNANR